SDPVRGSTFATALKEDEVCPKFERVDCPKACDAPCLVIHCRPTFCGRLKPGFQSQGVRSLFLPLLKSSSSSFSVGCRLRPSTKALTGNGSSVTLTLVR